MTCGVYVVSGRGLGLVLEGTEDVYTFCWSELGSHMNEVVVLLEEDIKHN